jgi:hypothetical protein
VSPDMGSDPGLTPTAPTAVGALVARTLRRARVLALAEAAAWGAAVAALSPIAGLLTALVAAAWGWRGVTRAAIVRALERAQPDARNLFVTADELHRDRLAARPAVRARVFADAAARAQQVDVRVAVPIARLVRAALVAAAAWVIVSASSMWRGPMTPAGRLVGRVSGTRQPYASPANFHITAIVQPPAYTGLKSTTTIDPPQLQAIEGSDLTLSIDARAGRVTIDHDGVTHPLARGADGRFSDRMHLVKTGYFVVTGDEGSRQLVSIVVSPDALPAVHVTAPGRDLVYAGGNPRITFNARATDDFGLRSLSLRYTKVTGSGEQFEFQEGEIPLAVATASARDWTGSASVSLSELNLKDGDMLVYRAVASDARPGDGSASSDAFFIEISRLGVAAGDAFTLPEEETRYALSQQMLIVKTERLHQQRAKLAPEALAEAALNLAVEQRMIRAEFVFMLGGEIQDEEVEAEQSTELQEGRLQNRGQRDVRAATIAMSQAQKLLTAANTGDALVAERAAVTALQRAFSRDRYILRALATRSQLDPARRLTGSLAGAADWHRVLPDVPANRRTARLEDLLSGLAELTRDAAATPASFRQRALVLAEEAVRIDPESAPLRQAATDLQRAADAAGDPAARAHAMNAAAGSATAEARRAHADAATTPPAVAPALSGAFADALARRP